MKKKMIQMMMVLGVGSVVMFSSQSQALSLNLSFSNGGVSVRLADDKHIVLHGKERKAECRDYKRKDNRKFNHNMDNRKNDRKFDDKKGKAKHNDKKKHEKR